MLWLESSREVQLIKLRILVVAADTFVPAQEVLLPSHEVDARRALLVHVPGPQAVHRVRGKEGRREVLRGLRVTELGPLMWGPGTKAWNPMPDDEVKELVDAEHMPEEGEEAD